MLKCLKLNYLNFFKKILFLLEKERVQAVGEEAEEEGEREPQADSALSLEQMQGLISDPEI